MKYKKYCKRKLVRKKRCRKYFVTLSIYVQSEESSTEKCVFVIDYDKTNDRMNIKSRNRIICMDIANSTYGDYNLLSIDQFLG